MLSLREQNLPANTSSIRTLDQKKLLKKMKKMILTRMKNHMPQLTIVNQWWPKAIAKTFPLMLLPQILPLNQCQLQCRSSIQLSSPNQLRLLKTNLMICSSLAAIGKLLWSKNLNTINSNSKNALYSILNQREQERWLKKKRTKSPASLSKPQFSMLML